MFHILWDFINKCAVCRTLGAKFGTQKMAELTSQRVTDSLPFSYCVVDMSGYSRTDMVQCSHAFQVE